MVKRNGSRLIWVIIVSAIIVVTTIGVLNALTVNSNNGENIRSSSSSLNKGNYGHSPVATIPLVLLSIQNAENAVNAKLVLPDPTLLGSSFKVAGVRINELPTNVNYTATNGTTMQWTEWSVTLFLWDQTFANGTTNVDIFNSGGLAIVESPAPLGGNSLASAQEMMASPTVCQSNNSTTSQCLTYSSPDPAYIVNKNGLSVVVSPVGNQLTWLDDKRNMWVNIVGENVAMNQLLALAGNMTEATVAA